MAHFLRHPEVFALPTCDDCRAYCYDRDWKPVIVGKKRMRRPKDVSTPCGTCPKLAPEDRRNDPRPEKAVTLDDRNWQAWAYVRLVREDPAGVVIPRDALTLRLCAAVRRAEEAAAQDAMRAAAMEPLMVLLAARGR